MAKYETTVHGTIEDVRNFIDANLSYLGETISIEEQTLGEAGGVKYYVAGLERYAFIGQNRVSLNMTMLEYKDGVRVIATSLGGSQAVFMKVNHWSEDNFLQAFVNLLDAYEKN